MSALLRFLPPSLASRRVERLAEEAHAFYGLVPGAPLLAPLHPAELVYGPLWVPCEESRLTVLPEGVAR